MDFQIFYFFIFGNTSSFGKISGIKIMENIDMLKKQQVIKMYKGFVRRKKERKKESKEGRNSN